MELLEILSVAIFLVLVYMGIGIGIRTMLQKLADEDPIPESANMPIIIGWPFVLICIIICAVLQLRDLIYYEVRKKRWQNKTKP